MDRQQEYLRLLQERNRLKKMVKEKSPDELAKEDLEKGFSTHFRGANASKDPQKPLGKPTVKVHRTPPIDIIKRLEQGPQSKYLQNSPSRTTISEMTNDSELYEDIDDQQTNDTFDSQPQEFKTESYQEIEKTNLNDILLGKISSLNEDQKFALLQLLHETSKTSTSNKDALDQNEKDELANNETKSDNIDFQEKIEEQEEKEDLNESHKSFKIQNPVSSPRINTNHILESHSPSQESIHLAIKLKMFSTWENSKNVTIQGIRLRYCIQTINGGKLYLDILHHLQFSLFSGMVPINQSSDSVRYLNTITGNTYKVNSGLWKAPISNFSSLEFVASGELPLNIYQLIMSNCSLENNSFSFNNLELVIWNGLSSNTDSLNDSQNASPCKDMDIYFNDQIIWSGELSEQIDKLIISRNMDSFGPLNKFETQPSLTVKCNKISLTKSANTATSNVEIDLNNDLSIPSRSFVKTPTSSNDPAKPDWLQSEASKSLKDSSKIIFSENSPIRASLEKPAKKSPSPELARKQARINKRIKNRLDAIEESGTPSPVKLSSKFDKKGNDEILRHSLEALEHSEQFNLNRLDNIVSRKPRRRQPNPPDEPHEEYQSTPTTPSTPIRSIEKRNVEFSSENNNYPTIESPSLSEKTFPMSDRSAKIETVNAKLSNVLHDLADILNTLPKGHISRTNSSKKLLTTVSDQDNTAEQQFNFNKFGDISLNNKYNELPICKLKDKVEGEVLKFVILSTHGDINYVGMNGIEIFDEKGQLLSLGINGEIESITAIPSDLTVLPGYNDDPRKVINLLDGNNHTKDDLHQWLAPQAHVVTEFIGEKNVLSKETHLGALAIVTINFKQKQSLSMVRIFNFNKSRTHNQRGVKDVKIFLDNQLLFDGEIKKASGLMKSSDADNQLIIFTEDTSLLAAANNDNLQIDESIDKDDNLFEDSLASPNFRPRTSEGKPPTTSEIEIKEPDIVRSSLVVDSVLELLKEAPISSQNLERNMVITEPIYIPSKQIKYPEQPLTKNIPSNISNNNSKPPQNNLISSILCISVRYVKITIESTWGDSDYAGLSGLEVIGLNGMPIPLSPENFNSQSHNNDMFSIGSIMDDRGIENLVNGINNTANDRFMWLAPQLHDGTELSISLDLKYPKDIIGLKFWNYNGNFDACRRGCKTIVISLDNQTYFRTILRPGPEFDGIDFSQTIIFEELFNQIKWFQKPPRPLSYFTPKVKQFFEVVAPPCASLFRFTFHTNHGDDYYLGLDRIELFDANSQIIDLTKLGVKFQAIPSSVRDLSTSPSDNLAKDPRTPDKIFLPNSTSWLSPLAHCMTESEREACVERLTNDLKSPQASSLYLKKRRSSNLPTENVLFILFPYPVTLSAIKFYNYSKTSSRGVRDFSIFADHSLVFMGSLAKHEDEKKVELREERKFVSKGQAIIFSQDAKVLNLHREVVSGQSLLDQDVLCINERQVMIRSKNMYNQTIPMEEVDIMKRPTTSFIP